MVRLADDHAASRLRRVCHALDAAALDLLVERIGDARFVLIGEASHGTHEFYEVRARITRRLIEHHGFRMVVAEADWPDAHRVNRYVRGAGGDADAAEALGGFVRFPQWMWRNTVVADFVGWLRTLNDGRGDADKCGFHGMDLYSLHASIGEVLGVLDRVDPAAAARARERYACFDAFGPDPQSYAYAAHLGLAEDCREQVVRQLVDVRVRAAELARRDGRVLEDDLFQAEQNARLVHNAEEYYRTMMEGHAESWNRRDRHMVQTLAALEEFWRPRLHPAPVKMVVWAHNSHLGDAAATEMGERGEVNVGQLVRERWAGECFNVGFSTHSGTVTAADNWNEPAERMEVNAGLADSYEGLFHRVGLGEFLLFPSRDREAVPRRRLQRAIGVIYRPRTERQSHYFHSRLADQFDAMIHIDRTRAVEPLERYGVPAEEAETFPTGV